jgi:hypothetical protein
MVLLYCLSELLLVCAVHSENGTRIGCGIIEKVSGQGVLSSVTTALTGSGATSQVSLHTVGGGVVCYFGLATSLERDLVSVFNPDPYAGGMDCNFTNGCGVHVHNGTACTDKTTQGGHFYGADVEIDPWLHTMYYSTDQNGEAYYTGCVDTNISDASSFTDRPFIVHSNNGSRVSCGLLQASTVVSPTAPTPAKPTVPTPTMPSTSHATAVLATVNVGLILTAVVSCCMLI